MVSTQGQLDVFNLHRLYREVRRRQHHAVVAEQAQLKTGFKLKEILYHFQYQSLKPGCFQAGESQLVLKTGFELKALLLSFSVSKLETGMLSKLGSSQLVPPLSYHAERRVLHANLDGHRAAVALREVGPLLRTTDSCDWSRRCI